MKGNQRNKINIREEIRFHSISVPATLTVTQYTSEISELFPLSRTEQLQRRCIPKPLISHFQQHTPNRPFFDVTFYLFTWVK